MTQSLKPSIKAALDLYVDRGFTVFPLQGKVPPKGFHWTAAPFDLLATPEDFPSGNFGIKLDLDDLVIDVDPRNFPENTNPVIDLQKEISFDLAATFTVQTGSGGLHHYFKKPADWPVKHLLKKYPGIDFKSQGGYVVGAGSIHPQTGKEYLITNPGPILTAPRSLLGLIQKAEISSGSGAAHYTDDEQTRGRFILYLKTAPQAVEGAAGDRTTYTVAAVGHDLGLHPDATHELMLRHYNPHCQPPWSEAELRRKVYNAYRYSNTPIGNAAPVGKFEPVPVLPGHTSKDIRMQNGKIARTVFNTVALFNIDLPGMLAFNVFSEDVVFLKPAPWHRSDERVTSWIDSDTAKCKYFFSNTRHFDPLANMIEDALVTVAAQHSFHPIKQYLEGLTWDRIPRLETWLTRYASATDDAYTRAVGLKMMVAAVARIYQPGHKFDYIPVLEGKQGIGKSRAVAILGGPWYGDITVDVHAKDTVDIMRKLWIIEVSEMETQYRTETQALKSFLSRSEDICRLAYGRRSKVFPRHSIFIGTINPEDDGDAGYLKDTTGNRRFWPVYCPRFYIDELAMARDQLWAEAFVYYKDRIALHFEDNRIEEQAFNEQTKRLGIDPWLDRVTLWINSEPTVSKNVLSGNEIYTDCIGGRTAQYTRVFQNRISIIMRTLGWEKGVFYRKETGDAVRGYKRPSESGL